MSILIWILPDIYSFVTALNTFGQGTAGGKSRLSTLQCKCLSFLMTGLILTGACSFAALSRYSWASYTARGIGKMFHSFNLPLDKLYLISVKRILSLFGVKGYLVCDDTDRPRAKGTTKLFGVFKSKDKKTGGYGIFQNIVFLFVVTDKGSFPVAFRFYRPDPAIKAWKKKDEELRKAKVPRRKRPKAPKESPEYPNRNTIFVALLEEFKTLFPEFEVTSICADAAFLSKHSRKAVATVYPDVQFISQLKQNQIVSSKKSHEQPLIDYFKYMKPLKKVIQVRGGIEKVLYYCSARLYVKAHGKKAHIIALREEGEAEYRYLAASELTWHSESIIKAYSMRWLIEVFIEDWKCYDGWGKAGSQYGKEGARRGVLLSLLVDHFLLSHPLQLKRVNAGKPLLTAGSLVRYLQFQWILDAVTQILDSPNPKEYVEQLRQRAVQIADFRESKKHMSGAPWEELGPTKALLTRYGKQAA